MSYIAKKRVGVVVKDKFSGKNIEEWKKACETFKKNYEEIDISTAIGVCLAEKDEEEVVCAFDLIFFLSSKCSIEKRQNSSQGQLECDAVLFCS